VTKVDPMNCNAPKFADEAVGAGRKREVTIAAIQAKMKRTKASFTRRRRASFRVGLLSWFSVTT